MELKDTGYKNSMNSTVTKKARIDGVPQSNSIASYFQKTSSPETNKPTKNIILTKELDNTSPDGVNKNDRHTQEENGCDDNGDSNCPPDISIRHPELLVCDTQCVRRNTDICPSKCYQDSKSDCCGELKVCNHGDCSFENNDVKKDGVSQSSDRHRKHAKEDYETCGSDVDNIHTVGYKSGHEVGSNSRKVRRPTELSKSKWNFSWKATGKRSTKETVDFPDSDSDFEESGTNFAEKAGQQVVGTRDKQVAVKLDEQVVKESGEQVTEKSDKQDAEELGEQVDEKADKPNTKGPGELVMEEPNEQVVSETDKQDVVKSDKQTTTKTAKIVTEEPGEQIASANGEKSEATAEYECPNGKSRKNKRIRKKTSNSNKAEQSGLADKPRKSANPLKDTGAVCLGMQDVHMSSLKEDGDPLGISGKSSPEMELCSTQNKNFDDFSEHSADQQTQVSSNVEINAPEEKLQDYSKSAFDVLMKSSRDKSTTKTTCTGIVCEGSDREMAELSSGSREEQKEAESGKRRKKDRALKARDPKKCTKKKQTTPKTLNKDDREESQISQAGHECSKIAEHEGESNPRLVLEASDGEKTEEARKSASVQRTHGTTRRSCRRSVKDDSNQNDNDLETPVEKIEKTSRKRSRPRGHKIVVEDTKTSAVLAIKVVSDEKIATKKQDKGESHRLKKQLKNSQVESENQEDITQDASEASELRKEDKLKEHAPTKAPGAIAPIFLPGAWRRAKHKVEQEQLQDSIIEVDKMDEDPVLENSSQGSCATVGETTTFESNLSKPYSPIKDVSQNMQAFMRMFKPSPMKSSAAVVNLVDAPFPRVSHVLQLTDELREKWNLPMICNRFVKEEFLISADCKYVQDTELRSFSGFLVHCVKNTEEAIKWKCLQATKFPEINEFQKQAVIRYLKIVYPGIPVKKLFKRCHTQLERCRKVDLESLNTERHVISKRNVVPQVIPNTGNKNPSSVISFPTSSQDTEKRSTFTKVTEKMSVSSKEKRKLNKTKESPLLMAFKKQTEGNTSSSNEENIQISNSSKKGKPPARKTSLRDYLGLKIKKIERSAENPASERGGRRSTRAKRKPAVGLESQEEANVYRKGSESSNCRKRERDGLENDPGCDPCVEKGVGPLKKKAKVATDSDKLKQPTKGKKRKQNGESLSESVMNANESPCAREAGASIVEASPKISSEEDFVETSKFGKKSARRTTRREKKAAKEESNSEAEGNGLRKSRRLQERFTEEKNTEDSNVNENITQGHLGNAETDKKDTSKLVAEVKVIDDSETKNECVTVSDASGIRSRSREAVSQVKQPSEENTCETRAKDAAGQRPSVLWTECFRPASSGEILGNSSGGNKLKKWVLEWRSLREKKLDKLRRHQEKKRERMAAKQAGEKASSEWWYQDDDSDFDLSDDSDDDYCDEEELLCNTMLLTGPTGCGKTSAVYACAQELGFKVIEVNSSSKRGGKYILSELQEATQSHQVARKRNPLATEQIFPPVSTSTSLNVGGGECDRSKKASKKGKRGDKKDTKPGKGKRAKKEQLETWPTTEIAQGQMSLILLDEVDVLFEEDKGFWVAVNSLRLNSKRPIVMTSSDPVVNIDGRYEQISLKSPLTKLHAAYLQSVCLSKNILVSPPDLQTLAALNRGDIRRSLLNLQFWIDSNAGGCDPHGTSVPTEIDTSGVEVAAKRTGVVEDESDKKTMSSKQPCTEEVEGPVSSTEICHTSENISQVYPMKTGVSEAETFQSSNSEPPVTLAGVPQRELYDNAAISESSISEVKEVDKSEENAHSLESVDPTKPDAGEPNVTCQSVDCIMHQLCVESLLGLRNVTSTTGGALKVLACKRAQNVFDQKDSFVYKSSVASHCQTLGLDVIRCNLETLLPCLFAFVHDANDVNKNTNVVDTTRSHSSQKDDRCIKTNKSADFSENRNEARTECGSLVDTSLFDDEAWENRAETSEAQIMEKTGMESSDEVAECKSSGNEVEDEGELERKGFKEKVVAISLEAYSEFLEDMSFMDSELHSHADADQNKRHERFGNWYARVLPGLEDTADQKSTQFAWKSRAALNDIRGALEVASLEHSHKHFHDRVEEAGHDFKTKSFGLLSNSYDCSLHCCKDWVPTSVAKASDEQRGSHMATSGNKKVCNDLRASSALQVDPQASRKSTSTSSLRLATPSEIFVSKTKTKREQDFDKFIDYLPDYNQLNRCVIALDYIPTLHNMCHSEFLRRASRTKRRFYHYFDSIGLNFPQSTVQLLNEDRFRRCGVDSQDGT